MWNMKLQNALARNSRRWSIRFHGFRTTSPLARTTSDSLDDIRGTAQSLAVKCYPARSVLICQLAGSNGQLTTTAFIVTNPLKLAKSELNERIGLLASTEDHSWERSPHAGRPKPSCSVIEWAIYYASV
jgi:hypothetical protein